MVLHLIFQIQRQLIGCQFDYGRLCCRRFHDRPRSHQDRRIRQFRLPAYTLFYTFGVRFGVRAKRAKKNQRHNSQYEEPSGDALGRVLGLFGHLIFKRSPPGVFHSPVIVNHLSGAAQPLHIIS